MVLLTCHSAGRNYGLVWQFITLDNSRKICSEEKQVHILVHIVLFGCTIQNITAKIQRDFRLATEFVKLQFTHEPREANTIAHKLARLAKRFKPICWLDDPTQPLIPVLIADVTNIDNQ
jgi:hypothetical protein